MFFGMFLMFILMVGGMGWGAWVIGRRLIAHARENPEAAKAISEHIIAPLFGENNEGAATPNS